MVCGYNDRVTFVRPRVLWYCVGAAAPFVAAAVLVPWRESLLNANVALLLVAVIVAVAVAGGRQAGAVAAVASAVAFDLFHTLPYGQLRMSSGDDVETTVLLLAVGLAVGHVAALGRDARRSADQRGGEIRWIYRVAETAAGGADVPEVIAVAQAELAEVLTLRECRFESPPFDQVLDRFERSGAMPIRQYRIHRSGFELPAEGAELAVFGRGQLLGRFVLTPTAGIGVSLEQRVVAVAIADQVGAALVPPDVRLKGISHG